MGCVTPLIRVRRTHNTEVHHTDEIRPVISVLSAVHISHIKYSYLKILTDVGVRVDSEKGKNILTRAGAPIVSERVLIQVEVVE